MLYAIVAALVIIFDQAVKYWVADAISYNSAAEPFIPGILSLVNVHNDGAAFSMLAGGEARIYFIILTGVFTVAVIIALASRFISGKVARWSIVLVTAGGLSNCIDRMIYGYVQDMFKVELFNFAVFNVADIFITVFAILFAIAMIFEKDPTPDDDDRILFENDNEEEDRPSHRRKAERIAAREAETVQRKPRIKADDDEVHIKRERRAKYEEEFEQFKAARPAREANSAAAAVAAKQKAPANKPVDPFAEWEKASARAAEKQMNSPAAKAAGINKAAQVEVAKDRSVVAEVPAAPKAQPKPAATVSDSFDLDDILNEFK